MAQLVALMALTYTSINLKELKPEKVCSLTMMTSNQKSMTEGNLGRKFINMQKLDNTPLNNQWVMEGTMRKIIKHSEMNENKNIMYQNLWDAAKTVLKEKFTL